jgi:multiple sugar transport system substrate-binding protein
MLKRLPLLLALILGWVLAGCQTPTQPVTFLVFGDPAEFAAYENLVAQFEQKFPEIDIELGHIPSQAAYRQQLTTSFASNTPPDIMLMNQRRVALFAAEGGLEPLGQYLTDSDFIQEADFFPEAIESFQFRDELWCIPQNVSSLVVYYNKDLFEAAGVPLPSNNWTRDDFVSAARTLTQDTNGDGVTDQYGVGVEANFFRLAPFLWQDGLELVDDPTNPTQLALDTPAALATFQWFVDLQVKEQVAPSAVAEAAEQSESRFLNGTLAMFFNSRRGVPTYRTIQNFTWDVAPLPRGQQAASVLHSDGYCMAALATNKEAAWTFIEFANSAEGQTIIAQSGRTVPSLTAVASSPAFLDPTQPPANSQIFVDTIPTLRVAPILTTWVAIEETAGKEVERAFYGQATVAEAARTAIQLTEPYFAQARP